MSLTVFADLEKLPESLRSVGLVDTVPDDVHGENLALLVGGADVSVDVTAKLATVPAVRALEPWILTTGVEQVPVEAVLPLEDAIARWAGMVHVHDFVVSWQVRQVNIYT